MARAILVVNDPSKQTLVTELLRNPESREIFWPVIILDPAFQDLFAAVYGRFTRAADKFTVDVKIEGTLSDAEKGWPNRGLSDAPAFMGTFPTIYLEKAGA